MIVQKHKIDASKWPDAPEPAAEGGIQMEYSDQLSAQVQEQ